eukprot:COSAG01_NODE_18296_length_1086_cov_1.098278_2_plen_286_part_01
MLEAGLLARTSTINVLESYLQQAGIRPTPAKSYASMLVGKGFDTIAAFEELSAVQMEELGIELGHRLTIERFRAGKNRSQELPLESQQQQRQPEREAQQQQQERHNNEANDDGLPRPVLEGGIQAGTRGNKRRCCTCRCCCKWSVLFLLVLGAAAGVVWYFFGDRIRFWWDTRHPEDPMNLGLKYLSARCNSVTALGCNPYQVPLCTNTASFDPSVLAKLKGSDITLTTVEKRSASATARLDTTASESSANAASSFGIGGGGLLSSVFLSGSAGYQSFTKQMYATS